MAYEIQTAEERDPLGDFFSTPAYLITYLILSSLIICIFPSLLVFLSPISIMWIVSFFSLPRRLPLRLPEESDSYDPSTIRETTEESKVFGFRVVKKYSKWRKLKEKYF